MWRVINSPTGTAHQSPDPVTGEMATKWPNSNPAGEEQIAIAGKTGTAEVGMKRDDGTHDASHSWFTCYAPFENPEVVVTVFLKEGGEGSSYAVPVADKVMRAYFEITDQRERGVVLRTDRQPIGRETPGPSFTLESMGDGAGGAVSGDAESEEEAAGA